MGVNGWHDSGIPSVDINSTPSLAAGATQMETFSALLVFVRGIHRSRVNSLHKGQWPGDLTFFFICTLSKQPWGWWFATPLCSLWRHCNVKLLSCECHLVLLNISEHCLVSSSNNPLSEPIWIQIKVAICAGELSVLSIFGMRVIKLANLFLA